MYLLGP